MLDSVSTRKRPAAGLTAGGPRSAGRPPLPSPWTGLAERRASQGSGCRPTPAAQCGARQDKHRCLCSVTPIRVLPPAPIWPCGTHASFRAIGRSFPPPPRADSAAAPARGGAGMAPTAALCSRTWELAHARHWRGLPLQFSRRTVGVEPGGRTTKLLHLPSPFPPSSWAGPFSFCQSPLNLANAAAASSTRLPSPEAVLVRVVFHSVREIRSLLPTLRSYSRRSISASDFPPSIFSLLLVLAVCWHIR